MNPPAGFEVTAFADDLEALLNGRTDPVQFKAKYGGPNQPEVIHELMAWVSHFLSDVDIRERDAEYRATQELEMHSLIRHLRAGRLEEARRITFLGPRLPASARRRVSFAALVLSTIVLGLLLQRVRHGLPSVAGDALGDALWAMMIYWIVGGISLALSRSRRAVIAVLVCWSVELSQLYHAPWVDGLRRTTFGHLVLGTGFDPRDFVAYACGIAIAFSLERILTGSHRV